MHINEVVAIWRNHGLLARKLSVLLTIQEKLPDGLSLDIHKDAVAEDNTVWVSVHNYMVNRRMASIRLKYVEHDTFSQYHKSDEAEPNG